MAKIASTCLIYYLYVKACASRPFAYNPSRGHVPTKSNTGGLPQNGAKRMPNSDVLFKMWDMEIVNQRNLAGKPAIRLPFVKDILGKTAGGIKTPLDLYDTPLVKECTISALCEPMHTCINWECHPDMELQRLNHRVPSIPEVLKISNGQFMSKQIPVQNQMTMTEGFRQPQNLGLPKEGPIYGSHRAFLPVDCAPFCEFFHVVESMRSKKRLQ